jgi:hypothetical protein
MFTEIRQLMLISSSRDRGGTKTCLRLTQVDSNLVDQQRSDQSDIVKLSKQAVEKYIPFLRLTRSYG